MGYDTVVSEAGGAGLDHLGELAVRHLRRRQHELLPLLDGHQVLLLVERRHRRGQVLLLRVRVRVRVRVEVRVSVRV